MTMLTNSPVSFDELNILSAPRDISDTSARQTYTSVTSAEVPEAIPMGFPNLLVWDDSQIDNNRQVWHAATTSNTRKSSV